MGTGLTTTYGFNNRLQMTAEAVGSLLQLNYGWGTTNNNGNLLSENITAGGSSFTQAFGYDNVNRLMSAAETSGWSRNFGYDALGNSCVASASGIAAAGNVPVCVSGVPPASSAKGTWYTAANQLTSAGAAGCGQTGSYYDCAGNLTQLPLVPGATQAYDAENRITQVSGSGAGTYQYDAEGRRVAKTGSGTTTVYVYDAAGVLAAEYASNQGSVPCTTCYLSADHLGSTRLVTDSKANVVSRHDYLPFGEEIGSNVSGRSPVWGASDNVNQKFTGKERDAESGLDYFGARYYGSALGRFTSPDEFKGGIVDPFTGQDIETNTALPYADITDPQTLNKYAYVRNNPLRYTDPDGHCAEDLCIVEGAAVTTGALYGGAAIAGALGFTATAAVLHDKGDAIISGAKTLVNSIGNLIVQSESKPGTLGKADHQQTANEEAQKIGGQREVTIKTPGGQKGSRRADAAKVDENGNPTDVTQVYRPTPAGNVPKREVDAANDIQNATGVKPNMVPVRPAKPPCNSGGTCSQ